MTSGRILVVDDDPQIRRVLRTSLISQGYEIDDVRNGEEALERVRHERFDLILLDMNMPGIGGVEACRSLRSGTDAAIIMLTVRDSEQDKVQALDAGADDYVTKPFSFPELLARIRAALRRTTAASETAQVFRFDEIEVNLLTRRVTVEGREEKLTPKEFDLLQYLMAHPNIPISHARLLQAVWGPDHRNEVEYLRVFINQLRKKIETNPSTPQYLLTEPWVGYRLRLPE